MLCSRYCDTTATHSTDYGTQNLGEIRSKKGEETKQ